MKGTIVKIKDGFGIGFTSNKSEKFIYTILPLNPYQITDGLEVGMEVEFEIEKFWETGIEEPFDVASLIIPFISDNIRTDGKEFFHHQTQKKEYMAKATLEFDLNDPDESRAHLRAVKSTDLALVLWEMAYNTKKSIHNQIEFDKLDAYDAVDKVFEKLWEEMNNHGINLDDLIV